MIITPQKITSAINIQINLLRLAEFSSCSGGSAGAPQCGQVLSELS